MKKAFDQTVRDLKRGVNKKVLKVPSIEQKVLDATSNEPWGPHGSLLADIAQATKNYHEYQMIMAVIWKRINDTGKNWRHVYKGLTVLEYLVAHGSERVIDDIREHGYQISTLSDFQYIDSSGRDQGNNIRRKSQSLVVLVNDKERIQEVRQKAAANRDKYRTSTAGGMYRPGSGSYGDKYDDDRYEGRYGNRDDDPNDYGRERDWGSRDDDKGRYGDSYGREGDRYGRYNDDRSSRDGYKDDDYRGRGQSIGDDHYGSRSRSADGDRYHANEDDEQYSSRGSGARVDEHSQDGSSMGNRLDRKYSEQSLGAPPNYEDAVSAGRSPTYSERDGEPSVGYAPKASSPTAASPSYKTTAAPAPVGPGLPPAPVSPSPPPAQPTGQDSSNTEEYGFDEFDPRGAFSAAPTASVGHPVPEVATSVEMDLLSLALVPVDTNPDANNASAIPNSGPTIADAQLASTITTQPFEDPFGDGPFKAISSTDTLPFQQQITSSTNNSTSTVDEPQTSPQNTATPFGFEPSNVQPPTNTQFYQQELSTGNHDIDILADILPPSAPSPFVNPQSGYTVPPPQSMVSQGVFPLQTNQPPPQTGFTNQTMALTYPIQASQPAFNTQGGPVQPDPANLNFYGNYHAQSVPGGPPSSAYNAVPPASGGPFVPQNFPLQPGSTTHLTSQIGSQVPQVRPSNNLMSTVSNTPATSGTPALASVSQSSKDKFETKSSVWADTLSRGLVNLNISGSKTNPLADIGVDFDAINRKEKRMEKPSTTTTTVTSTVTMGKAMGSGSGLGRAGVSVLTPPSNPMMGPGNMGMAGGWGMGMGGYGAGQPVGRGLGMGMPGNMGMGMNMGIGQQGINMQNHSRIPPGSTMPGNPNYGQQPYGGGYR